MYIEPQWNADKPCTIYMTDSTVKTLEDYPFDEYGLYFYSKNESKRYGWLIPWGQIRRVRYSRETDIDDEE